MVHSRLTTLDNPFDPFDEFDEWEAFDLSHGYGTYARLARVLQESDELPIEQIFKEREKAIDKIVSREPKMYKKVQKEI